MTFPCPFNSEDWIILTSIGVTMGGVLFAASLAAPQLIGITTLVVMAILVLGWVVTRSTKLGWLLPFGLVAGVLELWADWIHVEYLGSLIYTHYSGF